MRNQLRESGCFSERKLNTGRRDDQNEVNKRDVCNAEGKEPMLPRSFHIYLIFRCLIYYVQRKIKTELKIIFSFTGEIEQLQEGKIACEKKEDRETRSNKNASVDKKLLKKKIIK